MAFLWVFIEELGSVTHILGVTHHARRPRLRPRRAEVPEGGVRTDGTAADLRVPAAEGIRRTGGLFLVFTKADVCKLIT